MRNKEKVKNGQMGRVNDEERPDGLDPSMVNGGGRKEKGGWSWDSSYYVAF